MDVIVLWYLMKMYRSRFDLLFSFSLLLCCCLTFNSKVLVLVLMLLFFCSFFLLSVDSGILKTDLNSLIPVSLYVLCSVMTSLHTNILHMDEVPVLALQTQLVSGLGLVKKNSTTQLP